MNEEPNTELTELKKPGRPCKYTPETVERLLGAVERGLTLKQACVSAEIGETTLHEWRKEYPELEAQLLAAREQAREQALATIQDASQRDWKAAEAWLRLSFQSDYRQGGTKVEVNTNAQAGMVVVTEEKRRELQQRLKRLMEGDNQQPEQPEKS
jgi:hypothetical protein